MNGVRSKSEMLETRQTQSLSSYAHQLNCAVNQFVSNKGVLFWWSIYIFVCSGSFPF